MSSKRHVRRKACGDKQKHVTMEAASAALHHARKSGRANGKTAAYRCGFCGKYHWGHR